MKIVAGLHFLFILAAEINHLIFTNPKFFVMKKLLVKSAAVLLAAAFLSACSLTLPVTATSNPVGDKVGKAKGTGFLGVLFFNADASIQTAAKNGGIKEISTVDLNQSNVLNLIVSYECIVTGK